MGIGVIFKIAAVRSIDSSFLIGVNYICAAAVGLLFIRGDLQTIDVDTIVFLVSVLTGVLFIGGFYAMAFATRVAGVALTLSSWRMSVLLPFMASWIIWSEAPSSWQLVGLALAAVAFLLIANVFSVAERREKKSVGALVLVFVIGGTVDTILKLINESLQIESDSLIATCLIFGTAAAVMVVVLGIRQVRADDHPVRPALLPGAVLGVLNLGTIVFLLAALEDLPGTVVFPAINVAIVVGAALVGTIVWDEQLSRSTKWGVAIAVVALILLTAGS